MSSVAKGVKSIEAVNDFVIKFANVNGTGSASANNLFAKSIFRMGIPMSPKNIFPSNIQGLPTWYEVRVSEKGYLGRRGGTDFMVSVNPQSMAKDVKEVSPGGYFLYDNTKPLDLRLHRDDINFIGIPLMQICMDEYKDARQRQLFKNMIYVGALAALLDIEFDVLTGLIADQFKGKEKLIAPNVHALELGFQYAKANFECPCSITVKRCDNVGDRILLDGNTACGLGAVYAGATVAGWYPITPSTSVIEGFEKYCKRMRIDPASGQKNYAIVQAEDELAAIGMVIGASWNGARAFTATSGPGVSLMSEFLGLAYFAEIPTVLIDVQRAGPSTGMPTRTQQSDIVAAAYASHGDTKHVLLFPSTPKDCFDMTAQAFDLAERLQTPVIMLTDLDLGMNDNLSEPLSWDDAREYDRGKVFNAEELEAMSERFGRYLDVDGDGIPYRTYPGTHPTKGSFFTRGTSRDEYAVYTEDGSEYVKNMERLLHKWETAKSYVPAPEIISVEGGKKVGLIHFGTSKDATLEAVDKLAEQGITADSCRIKAFPFNHEVEDFIAEHDTVFVIEQNRDAQMRQLLVNECEINPKSLVKILHYDGMPITADTIAQRVKDVVQHDNVTPIKRAQ
ncbi:2-oxoacid:acceptor oxidoreductase subunit alpha [uncultured Pseudoteredinibacter sp.]|uniref:2-oxoacid:acceptor oxidoreductase subunit alpha n=1 Tax=uncultured Pseudoteredinibacter sp. TaxID=1641701 RepID=UPI0026097945|nr:2-oxoacid:acceptor oxidoreductase subunit alpha [uncultured Pseudoteredinibacter sp.]